MGIDSTGKVIRYKYEEIKLSSEEWMIRVMDETDYGSNLRDYILIAPPEVRESIKLVAKCGYEFGTDDAMEEVGKVVGRV